MSYSYQDVYAKNLQQACAAYGYPLRMPEPMNTLPQYYQDDGLQIGDVGIVDNNGRFDVLFNICKCSDNTLHDLRGVPENFEPVMIKDSDIKVSKNAISAGPIHSHGINQVHHHNEPRPVDYEFDTSTTAGAILILPHGAESVEHSSPEHFRVVAEERALDWYEFAKERYGVQHLNRSLYLITGFYKARSWSLGSFNNPTDTPGKIFVKRDNDDSNIYLLQFTFNGDRRNSLGGNDNNQSVFITGFKITISSFLQKPVVVGATESRTAWFMLVRLFKDCLNRLCGVSGSRRLRAPISMEHNPLLSQPFHPSDIINRMLLSKRPNARVAITHDNQWIEMMKEGLTHEDFLQEDRLEKFLTRYFTISVDLGRENAPVSLQGKGDGVMHSVSPTVDPHDASLELEMFDSPASELEVSPPPTPELEISPPTTPELKVSSPVTSEFEYSPPHTSSLDNTKIVITRMCPFFQNSCRNIRAQNISTPLKRIPVGFYVLVQFDGAQRRTQNKSIRLDDSTIEWEDEILLPVEKFDKVRFTVYASFELEPMLGNGEPLYTSETRVEELIGGTYLITFSARELGTAAPVPSLLITLGRWYPDHLAGGPGSDDSNLDLEESLVFVHETDLGRQALLRYQNEYRREDLKNVVQHFERALRICPSDRYRAVVLVNLAKAKFISHQIDPTSSNLDEVILLYREALDLRSPGRPDRPVTLLQLAQTLLFRYEKQGCNESVADEISKLMTEPQAFSQNSHEHRAADLVLETLERYRVVNSGSLAELDELVRALENSMKVPPDAYFDRPQRLINLSAALWKRYDKRGELSDLDRLLEINKQAFQLLPVRHPDRLPCLRIFGAILWELFEIHGDFSYLTELTTLSEEALQLIPEGHPERPNFITCSSSYLVETLERSGNTAIEAQKYDEAIVQYCQVIETLSILREVFF